MKIEIKKWVKVEMGWVELCLILLFISGFTGVPFDRLLRGLGIMQVLSSPDASLPSDKLRELSKR